MTSVTFKPIVEEVWSDEESSSSSSSLIAMNPPEDELSKVFYRSDTEDLRSLSEEAQGSTLGNIGNWMLRILAGAVGYPLYGATYLVTRIVGLAIGIPLIATIIPGAIVGGLLGGLIGGCIGGLEGIMMGAMVGGGIGGVITGLPLILTGLVVGGLERYLLGYTVGSIGASAIAFAKHGRMDEHEKEELMKSLLGPATIDEATAQGKRLAQQMGLISAE